MINKSVEQNSFQDISHVLPTLFAKSHIVLFRWQVSETWDVKYVSVNCKNIYGYSAEDFYNTPKLYENIVHPEDIKKVLKEIDLHIESKDISYRHEPYRIITKNKQIRWVDDFTQIEYDENGKATYLNGFIIDITNKINTNKRLEILTKGIEKSPATVVVTDINGCVNYVNQKFKDLTGYSFEEIKDKKLSFIQSGVHDKKFYKQMWEIILSGKSWRGEICNKKKNGELFWEDLTITPITDSKGNITHFLGIKEDITERKYYEDKLRESESNFSSLINNSLQSFILISRDRKILAFNNNAKETSTLIFRKEMKKDMLIDDFVLESDLKSFNTNFNRCIAGENFIVEKSFSVGRKEFTFNFNYNPVKNTEGYVTAISLGILDLTELKETSKQLSFTLEKLNLSLETANLSWWEWDIKSGQILSDQNRNITLGYDIQNVPKDYNAVFDLIHPDDKLKTNDALYNYLLGTVDKYEAVFRLKNSAGDYIWYSDTGKISEKDKDGNPTKVIGIIQNINKQKQTENARANILAEYERVVSSIPINIWKTTFDENAKVLSNYFSPIIDNLVEIDLPDTIGNDFDKYISFILDEDKDKLFNTINESLKKAFNKVDVEYRVKTPAGKTKFIRSRGIFRKINDNLFEAYGYKEDITSEVQNRILIDENEKRLKSLIDTIPDILFVLDKDGKYIDIHSPKDELLINPKEELIGNFIHNFLPKELVDRYLGFIRQTIEFEKLSHFEYYLDVPAGKKYFDARIIKNSNDSVLVVIRDITEKKIQEEELKKAKEDAEKSNRLKSEFLAQMSHEIRTPINAMLSFTSLLKEELVETIDDDLKDSFDIISNAGKRLIRTIDLILDMSDVQSGSYDYNPQEVNINNLLKNIVSEFSFSAKVKKLDLKIKLSENELIKFADEYTLKQIFANLIDNAIKYTKSGCVEIKSFSKDDKAVIEVIDTGIGISKENQSVIFEPFRQEDQGYSRKFEGNGLGLALVKNYCKMNNAEIEVESIKGEGSTFRVTF